MASNSNPTSSSAESTSKVIHSGDLEKLSGFYKRWQQRHFKLHGDGTLNRFKVPPISDDSKPTKSFTVIEFMPLNNSSPSPEVVLKVRFHDSPRVTAFKVRAPNLTEYKLWYDALDDVAKEVPTLEMEFAEMVNPSSGPSNCKVTKKNFTFVKKLGSGAYGTVFLGKLNGSDNYYAIKKLNKQKIVKNKQIEHTKTESRVLFFCKHPFLVSMAFAFQTETNIYFVMDYCIGGDLHFHLNDLQSEFDPTTVTIYAAEIAYALGFLHFNKVVYRDLKPENVLLDHDGHIKLADFGLCKENVDHENTTKTYCGTVQYSAPEVLERNAYDCAVDWWALGVVVYEMIYRRPLFFHEKSKMLCELITSGPPLEFPGIGPITRDFLTRLLEKDPKQRLGGTNDFKEVKKHKFFESIIWKKLYNRNVRPTFVPDFENAKMTKYFDKNTYQSDILADLPDDHPLQRNFNRLSLHEQRKDNNIPASFKPLDMS